MSLLDHDLHVHTYLSDCCHDKANHRPGQILRAAEEAGLATIGFADHVWVNPALEPSRWYRPQDATQISRLRDELASITTTARVLVGCEAETVAPGKFGITPEFAGTLDFVLLACSHFHMKTFVAQPPGTSARQVALHTRDFFLSAVDSGLATGIPHALMPCGFLERYDEVIAALSDAELVDAFGAAAARGVGIEITTSYLPPEPGSSAKGGAQWSRETPLRCLECAKRAGCRFYFATDAHELAQLARLPKLGWFADQLGLRREDLLPLARDV